MPTPSVGGTAPAPAADFSRASAHNLTIADSELIDPTGANPQFSPSGNEMLFDRKDGPGGERAIWLANSEGRDAHRLIPRAEYGSWSPDGKKIAFTGPGLSIFDVSTGKSFELILHADFRLLSGCNWTMDGKKLFHISNRSGRADLVSVDLETLKTQEKTVDDARAWLTQYAPAPADRSVAFSASRDGIWVSTVDGSYQRRLLEGSYSNVAAAPNLSTIAYSKSIFGGPGGPLFVAKLAIQEHPFPNTFRVELGETDREYIIKKSREGQILCEIFSPHVNPLNGKTVGFQGDVKAIAKLARGDDGSYEVEVVKEYAAVFSGDVVSDIWVEPSGPLVSGWPPAKRALEDVVILQPEDTRSASAETAARAEAERLASERAALQKDRQEALKRFTAKPLELVKIEFMSSTKNGTPLSGPTDDFDLSRVLFVQWQVTFENRLYKLDKGQYRVDASYIAPDGRMLGSANDWKTVSPEAKTVTFSGRIGNSAGGAFVVGQYTVNFNLNGQYFAQRKFRVVGTSATSTKSDSRLDTPMLANGTIDGIGGKDNIPMELRLRPQANGFLHGELVVHLSGYGLTPLEGSVRGNHLEFQATYGADTFYFDGERHANQLSGTFEASPSGQRGTWTASAG